MVDFENLKISDSIKKYIRAAKEKYDIEKVFLFGSYASGKASDESDIDLALIFSSFTGNRFIDNVNLGKLSWKIDTRIEPLGFRPEDFNSESILAEEIINTGIEIPII